ncbi:MAG: protein-L-isoaspartate(D-aspartate) O-methyltransferase [Candidatus Binatia bacterium]
MLQLARHERKSDSGVPFAPSSARDERTCLGQPGGRSPIGGVIFLLLLFTAPAHAALADSPRRDRPDSFAAPRRVMIERDLRGRGIKDAKVLAAMEAVPRHLFVPEKLRQSAYDDRPLAIGAGQTISQPYIVAFMTEILQLKPSDTVLEIGTGSGYQTSVLAELVAAVYSIEIVPSLGERAKKVLDGLGYKNIELRIGDGFYGWEERAPFDAILLTAASPKIPEPLWRQLREGGRLVMPLGEERRTQRLIRVRKSAGKQVIEDFSAVLFVPLRGAIEKPAR